MEEPERLGAPALLCSVSFGLSRPDGVSALAALLGYIHIRYGISEYVAGISRLFAMTDKATKYKPTTMIMGILWRYIETMY